MSIVICLIVASGVCFMSGYFIGKARGNDYDIDVQIDEVNNLPKEAHYFGRITNERIDVTCICEFRHHGVDFVLCALKNNNMLPPFSMRKDKLNFNSEEK